MAYVQCTCPRDDDKLYCYMIAIETYVEKMHTQVPY